MMSARSAASGMPGKASAIGDHRLGIGDPLVEMLLGPGEAFRAELFHAGGICGESATLAAFRPTMPLSSGPTRFCAPGPIW
jgi:hypothetical protein